jgi:hypothetical protein
MELGSILLLLHATLAPPPLPLVFNKPTAFYHIWQNHCILPYLHGPYKSWPSSNVATEEWVAKLNASYCSTLASKYQQWAPFPSTDLVLYLSDLRSQDVTTWPPLSSDWDTLQQEYNTQQVLFLLAIGSSIANAGSSSFLDMLRETCFLTKVFFFRSSFLKPFWWKFVFVHLFFLVDCWIIHCSSFSSCA